MAELDPVRQRVIFSCLYVSYLLAVYTRRSVTYALPDIASTENMDKNQMGLILSAQMVSYAISKLVSGVMIDSVSPKLALSTGLFFAALTTFLFASVHSSITMFTVFWILNGLAVGPSWPAAALIMKKWFRPDQFGTAWGILSTSMNLAGVIGPLITAYLITNAGWRVSLGVAALTTLLWVVPVLFIVKDQPSVEEGGNSKDSKQAHKDDSKEPQMSRLEMFKQPGYVGVCVTYGAISLIQFGLLQWGSLYLVSDLGHSILNGNSYVSSQEVGGICGSLMAGFLSDTFIQQNPQIPSPVMRQHVMAWFVSGLVGFLFLLTYCVTFYSSVIWINVIGFGLGLCLYGPISIYGVVAMEYAPKNLAGTFHAMAALFASCGQIIAGLPLSYVAKIWSLKESFRLLMGVAILVAAYLFLYSTIEMKKASKRQKKE